MNEGFDEWNNQKKSLSAATHFPRPKRRQVWWCAIGLNVGSEQSCEEGFERPVLVVKVFGSIFWGLPITSSDPEGRKKANPLYYEIEGKSYTTDAGEVKKLEGYIALHQLRVFDARRLKRKILRLEIPLFTDIMRELRAHLV